MSSHLGVLVAIGVRGQSVSLYLIVGVGPCGGCRRQRHCVVVVVVDGRKEVCHAL